MSVKIKVVNLTEDTARRGIVSSFITTIVREGSNSSVLTQPSEKYKRPLGRHCVLKVKKTVSCSQQAAGLRRRGQICRAHQYL